jgi:hypothetical protein
MSQKIWVIEHTPEKNISPANTGQNTVHASQQPAGSRKHPSIAYSLSMIVWGCGQFYNRQWKPGTLFLLFMIHFYLCMTIAVMYWDTVRSSFASMSVDGAGTLLVFGFFYLAGLILWHISAWQAYFKRIDMNAAAPKGVKMTLLPPLCSLLMPGWGQLLNGQIKKGIFFQFFAIAGLAAFPFILIIFFAWPTLEASRTRLIIEWIFSISIALSPCILMIWLCSIFDAAKVSIDETKKEPLPKRFKYATKRFRYHVQLYGWKNAALPLIRRNTLLILMVLFCVITFHSVPQKFYLQELQNLENRLSEKEMTVLPGIMKKILIGINPSK